MQYRDEQDEKIGSKFSELFGCFNPGKDKQHAKYGLINDICIFPRTDDNEEILVRRLNDADFRFLYPVLSPVACYVGDTCTCM